MSFRVHEQNDGRKWVVRGMHQIPHNTVFTAVIGGIESVYLKFDTSHFYSNVIDLHDTGRHWLRLEKGITCGSVVTRYQEVEGDLYIKH